MESKIAMNINTSEKHATVETRSGTTLGALVLIMSDIALLEAIYMILGANDSTGTRIGSFWAWASITIVVFAFYYLFLRKERTVAQAIIFLGVSYIITVLIMFIFIVTITSLIMTVIAILLWAAPLLHMYFLFEDPPKLDRLISRFSILIFTSLLVLTFIIGTESSFVRILPCLSTLILCLIAMIVVRTKHGGADGSSRIRGIGVIFGFLLLIGAIVAVFIIVSFGDTLAAGAAALWTGIVFLGNLVTRFFVWLASLFQVREFDAPLEAMLYIPSGEASAYGETWDFGETILTVFLIIMGICALVIITFLAIKLRKNKLGGKRTKRTIAMRRTKLGLRILLRRFWDNFKFFVDGIVYRNTPQGVFLKLERWGKIRRKGRVIGETPRVYLERISDSAPEQREALMKLADALDVSWYGDKTKAFLDASVIASIRKAFI